MVLLRPLRYELYWQMKIKDIQKPLLKMHGSQNWDHGRRELFKTYMERTYQVCALSLRDDLMHL